MIGIKAKIGQLETIRLRLLPLSVNDAREIQSALTKNVCKYVPEFEWPVEATDWVDQKLQDKGGYLRHVVRLSPSNKLIGFIQLYTGGPNTYDDDYAIELGYWISEQYWNLGYCSEMVSKVVEIAEANSWSQQILALIYDGNDASEKVLLKNGFRYSQVNRQTKYGDASIFVYETKHYKMLREKSNKNVNVDAAKDAARIT